VKNKPFMFWLQKHLGTLQQPSNPPLAVYRI